MNAMYDAPVDAMGHPMFAADRKANITLAATQQPQVLLGSDGSTLRRCKFVIHLVDCNAATSSGAYCEGSPVARWTKAMAALVLGMLVCHNSAAALFLMRSSRPGDRGDRGLGP